MTPLSPLALKDLYRELVRYPALVSELTGYQKSKLREYAESEVIHATRVAGDMMEGTPDYPYPDEYRNGREVEYLLNKHSPAYWDSQNVLQLLAEKPLTTVPAGAAAKLGQLSLQQVALLYTYQNKGIPKAAAASIARQHGHESGAKLYGHYTTVSQRAGRVGDDITGQKLAPMVKNITAVIPHLSGAQQQQAENELKTLQARKETPV